MRGSFKTALIAAVVSAVVSASAAVATTSNFILGSTTANLPDAPTAVTAKNVSLGGLNAKMLQLTNNSTGSSATALGLTTPSSRPPLIVNSQAKVANLNADKLDGIDSGGFVKSAKPAPGALVGETWHEIGTAGEPALTWCHGSGGCSQGWTYFGTPYNTPGYYKDALGVVHLKGLVKWAESFQLSGSCNGWSFFQLPVGYRPAATEIRASLKDDALMRIDVAADGWVTFCDVNTSVDPGDWFLFDGISFRAAH
jgi:hypothetical protein